MLSVKYDMPEINIPSVIHNDKKSIARFMIRNYHQINSCLSVFSIEECCVQMRRFIKASNVHSTVHIGRWVLFVC